MLKKAIQHLKGFTLVELLVVIAIIAVLSSIGVVSFRGARARANDGKKSADIRTMQSGIELYIAESARGLPPAGTALLGSPNALANFNALLRAINVTEGLVPPGGGSATDAYCYFEDNDNSTPLQDPMYVIAATAFNDPVVGGTPSTLADANYNVRLSSPASATICNNLNCAPSPDVVFCLGS